MACKDCPEPTKQPAADPPPKQPVTSQGWVVYTGGAPNVHLAGIANVIPDDYDRVIVDDSGGIIYKNKPDDWEPPSPIDGYIQETGNPLIFYPLWKSCKWRAYSAIVKSACNCLEVIARCNQPQAETFCQLVKCAVCDQCVERIAIPELPPRPKRKTL